MKSTSQVRLMYQFLLVFNNHIPCFLGKPCKFCVVNTSNFESIMSNFGEYLNLNE